MKKTILLCLLALLAACDNRSKWDVGRAPGENVNANAGENNQVKVDDLN